MNLIGKQFGKLTVIQMTEKRDSCRRIIWLCRCECGEEREVNTSALTGGKITSCRNCVKQQIAKKRREGIPNNIIKNDLTGKKFHRLTVLEPTNKRTQDRCIIWKCKCDCGNEIEVSTKSLTQNNTKSCGCLNTETRAALGRSHKKDLVGQVFGKLTVIEDSGQRYDNNVLWRCKCECGAETLIKGTSLLHGVQSCGCVLSKGEARIAKLLSQNNIKFEVQKTFDDCVFPDTRHKARFDFWVEDKYLIEYDGIQHFEYNIRGGKSWNTKENFIKTQQRDNYKTNWCKEKGIPLIRIPYNKLNTLSIEDLIITAGD